MHQLDSAPDSAHEVPHVGLMMVEDAPSTYLPAFDYAAIVKLFERRRVDDGADRVGES